MVRVKICGLTRPEDAEAALDLGADALGYVFEPASPRYLPRERRGFIAGIAPFATCVAVYGIADPPELWGCNLVQAVDVRPAEGESPSVLKVMRPRTADPGVLEKELLDWERRHPRFTVRGVVLDAFDADAFGGTGRRIDAAFAEAFVRNSQRPVVLAGGLTPETVAAVVAAVRPYAVDVSSGVESSPGLKDRVKVRDFIQAAKQASGG